MKRAALIGTLIVSLATGSAALAAPGGRGHDDINDFRAIPVTFEASRVYRLTKARLPQNWFKIPIPGLGQHQFQLG